MTDEIKNEKSNERKSKKIRQKSEKKARRGTFNFLDVIIIACIIAVVALLLLVYSPFEILGMNSRETTIIYTIRISGVPAEYAAAISVGDDVSDADGYILGNVASDVEVEPHNIYEYRENLDGSGGVVSIKHPELVDLIVTVSADADHSHDGYSVDGKRIAVESEYELVLPKFESKGICISLSEENASDAGA